MEFPENGLPEFGKIAPQLQSLDIRECSGQDELQIGDDAFKGLEQSLRNLTIHSCSLQVSFYHRIVDYEFVSDYPKIGRLSRKLGDNGVFKQQAGHFRSRSVQEQEAGESAGILL